LLLYALTHRQKRLLARDAGGANRDEFRITPKSGEKRV
jgi:hypothetical protein